MRVAIRSIAAAIRRPFARAGAALWAGSPGSVTAKNLCIFLPILMAALAPLALAYWHDVRAGRIAGLSMQLELIAEQSARRIEPAQVAALVDDAQTGSPAHRRLVATLAQIQADFGVDNAVLMRRGADGRFRFIADGNGQFRVGQPVFIHDEFPETFSAARRAWERNGPATTDLFGFGTYEYLQFHKAIDQDGHVVALLMLNRFAEDVDQAIKADALKLAVLTLGIALVGAVVFWRLSRRMLRPLGTLNAAARRVAGGDLGVEIRAVPGRDEVARLNENFGAMVRHLRLSRDELERNNAELTRTLARVRLMEDLEKSLFKLVPRTARMALHADPRALERGKTERDVTVLFLDVEGSSRLVESLAPYQLDGIIQGYFSQYLDCIYENQGDITETAGDGLMIIFQDQDPRRHALNAVRTALSIQATTERIRAAEQDGGTGLRINVGINSGPARVGFTRYQAISGDRVTFTASGRTTIVAARLQGVATGGSVLVSEETLRRVQALPEFGALAARVEDRGRVALKNLHDPEHVFGLCRAAAGGGTAA